MTWGVILIVLGVLLLLEKFGTLNFGDFVSTYWPAILVLIGLRLILFPRRAEHLPNGATIGSSGTISSQHQFSESRIFGDISLKVTSDDLAGGYVSSIIGDQHIDLSEVGVKSGEKTIRLSSFIGDVKISAPKRVPFMITANATLGDIRIFENKYEGFSQSKMYKSAEYDSAAARLRIYVSGFIGDVTLW